MIVFENKGVIDTRAIKIMGVSAKQNENAIGYFGTGLKYSIAILLRCNCEVTLVAGGIMYNFTKKTIDIRNKQFEIIMMNDYELPFTTELGKNWSLWQAFRELYCNASDEFGSVYRGEIKNDLDKDSTYFFVSGDEFESVYNRRDEIVLNLNSSFTRVETDKLCGYYKQSEYLYYKNIRVAQLPKPSCYTWNILSKCDLTEDRTLLYSNTVYNNIAHEISTLKDKDFIRSILLCPVEYFESSLNFEFLQWVSFASSEFIEVLEECYKSNNDLLNISAAESHIKLHNQKSVKSYEQCQLNTVEQKQMTRAFDIVRKVFPNVVKYELIVTKDLGQRTYALANMPLKQIVMSKKCFQLGTKFVVATLIEEVMHLETGYGDCSRELQTHLFDTLTSFIEEHILNEPI